MSEPRRVVAVVQARVSSTRLPRKVLREIGDKTMLEWVVDRLRHAQLVDEVVIATSVDSGDDEIVSFCAEKGIACGRGSLDDVLARYLEVARKFDADVIVRVTSDCPLVDPVLVDDVVRRYLEGDATYVANRLPEDRTYPIGLDAEAFSLEDLERADREATEQYQREHVTPWFYDGSSSGAIGHVRGEFDAGSERWTVDTADDLELVREIHARLGFERSLQWTAILDLLNEHPELRDINGHVRQKSHRDVGVKSS